MVSRGIWNGSFADCRYCACLLYTSFTPIIEPTFGRALLAVKLRTSGVPDSHGVTGGVYKALSLIHISQLCLLLRL